MSIKPSINSVDKDTSYSTSGDRRDGVTPEKSRLVMAAVLKILQPIVRWLIRNGITFPQFSESLKPIFLEQARQEIDNRKGTKPVTDSALSLLSGVHRRDIRAFRLVQSTQSIGDDSLDPNQIPSRESTSLGAGRYGLAAQVYARWVSDPLFLDVDDQPVILARQSFDALVASISTDVRPRAVLDQLQNLGMVEVTEPGAERDSEQQVRLLITGFVPRAEWGAMAQSASDNLTDHLSAAIDNLDDKNNWLEQAIFSDQMSADSALKLHTAAAQTWRANHRKLMQLAQHLYEYDQATYSPHQLIHRARVGMYFFSAKEIGPGDSDTNVNTKQEEPT